MTTKSVFESLARIKAEYLEMPGLRLTPAQAQRLWGLDSCTCEGVLAALVDAKFLYRTGGGAYAQLELSTVTRSR